VIEGTFAIVLNVLAIAIITFVVSSLVVSVVVSTLAQRFVKLEVSSRKLSLWLLATIPWIAVVCVAACFIYQYHSYSIFTPDNSLAHWHHMSYFTVLSWHGATVLAASFIFALVIYQKLKALVSHNKELALLRSLSSKVDNDIYQVELPQASAFTGGFLSKHCYITTGMLAQTTAEEQAIIFRHEKAHAQLNDPFKKWFFSLLTAFFIPVIANRLRLHMTLAMEQAADREAISSELSATLIASTLIKVARLNKQSNTMAMVNSELVTSFGVDVLEQRVFFLLGQLELKPANKLLTAAFVLSTLVICIISVDGIHHLMETVFSH